MCRLIGPCIKGLKKSNPFGYLNELHDLQCEKRILIPNDAQHLKKVLMPHANREGPDELVQPCSLI